MIFFRIKAWLLVGNFLVYLSKKFNNLSAYAIGRAQALIEGVKRSS